MSIKIMAEVWELDLGRDAKIVLLAFADHADDDGLCHPSFERIAWKCGYSRSSVKRKVSALCDLGVLAVLEEGRGRGRPSRYQVRPGKGVKLTPFHEKGFTGDAEKGSNRTGKGSRAMTPESSENHQENRQTELLADQKPSAPKANEGEFQKTWKLYRSGGRANAWEQYRRAVPAKIDAARLHATRERYVAHAERNGHTPQALFRWIRDERWEEDLPDAEPSFADAEDARWQRLRAGGSSP